jgi:hypothetical protein
MMWEHAAPFVGIPGAINACLQLLDRVKKGANEAREATAKTEVSLAQMKDALKEFAVDALELAAFKKLHTITNQFMIDLHETLMLDTPDRDWARNHHDKHLLIIKLEWQGVWQGERAGAQLANLRASRDEMKYLKSMPLEVREKLSGPSWDEYYWELLKRSEQEVENFRNFYDHVAQIRGFNSLLNNYANRSIERGIDDFNKIMNDLRIALAK